MRTIGYVMKMHLQGCTKVCGEDNRVCDEDVCTKVCGEGM